MTVRPVLIAVVLTLCLLAILPVLAAGEEAHPQQPEQHTDRSAPPSHHPQADGDHDRSDFQSHHPSHPDRPDRPSHPGQPDPPCSPCPPPPRPPACGDWSWLPQAERELAAALSLTERQQQTLKRQTARLEAIVGQLRSVEKELEDVALAGEKIAKELEETKTHPRCAELEKRLLAALKAAAVLVAELDALLEKADCEVTSLLRLLADQRCRITGQLQAITAAGRLIARAREEQSRCRCSRPREAALRKEIEAALASIHKTSAAIAAAEADIESALRSLEALLVRIDRLLCDLRTAAAAVLAALEKFRRCQREAGCEPEPTPCDEQQPQPPCDHDKKPEPCEDDKQPQEPCEHEQEPKPCDETDPKPDKPRQGGEPDRRRDQGEESQKHGQQGEQRDRRP